MSNFNADHGETGEGIGDLNEALAHDFLDLIEEDLCERYPMIRELQKMQVDDNGDPCGTLFHGMPYWSLVERIRDAIRTSADALGDTDDENVEEMISQYPVEAFILDATQLTDYQLEKVKQQINGLKNLGFVDYNPDQMKEYVAGLNTEDIWGPSTEKEWPMTDNEFVLKTRSLTPEKLKELQEKINSMIPTDGSLTLEGRRKLVEAFTENLETTDKDKTCKECGSDNVQKIPTKTFDVYVCECGNEWSVEK